MTAHNQNSSGPKWGRSLSRAERIETAKQQIRIYKRQVVINNCLCLFNIVMFAVYAGTGTSWIGAGLHLGLFAVHFYLVCKYTLCVKIGTDLLQEDLDNPHWK